MQTASEVEAAAALAANQAATAAPAAEAAEAAESAAPPPVRRGPPSSHAQSYPQTTASAFSHPVVDDGPHGRRRPAIWPAAHAHVR